HHLARVVEEVLHRHADAAHDLGQIALHLDAVGRVRHGLGVERRGGLLGERGGGHGHACMGVVSVPPCFSAATAEVPSTERSCFTGVKSPAIPRIKTKVSAIATIACVTSPATRSASCAAGPALSIAR